MSEYKYSLATDKEHKITLTPRLIYAIWSHGVAYAGQKARFEVGTAFVGLGAKIKVKGKSEGGKHLGKIDGKIRNNKFIGEFEIPEDIELDDTIYFEVKFPGNDLEGESNRIPVLPPIIVSNMKWSAKEARRGDILTLSADVVGCQDDTDTTIIIREYDADGAHDIIAKIPTVVADNKIEVQWEYEYHEDVDDIPTEVELDRYGKHYNHPEYFFVIDIAGQKFGEEQESGILKFKDWFEIYLSDFDSESTPDMKYILHMPDGSKREGKLDQSGFAREEDIPPGKIYIEFQESEPE